MAATIDRPISMLGLKGFITVARWHLAHSLASFQSTWGRIDCARTEDAFMRRKFVTRKIRSMAHHVLPIGLAGRDRARCRERVLFWPLLGLRFDAIHCVLTCRLSLPPI